MASAANQTPAVPTAAHADIAHGTSCGDHTHTHGHAHGVSLARGVYHSTAWAPPPVDHNPGVCGQPRDDQHVDIHNHVLHGIPAAAGVIMDHRPQHDRVEQAFTPHSDCTAPPIGRRALRAVDQPTYPCQSLRGAAAY